MELMPIPTQVKIPLHLILCLVIIFFTTISFSYYASIADRWSRKTVLTYLIQTHSALLAIAVVWFHTSEIVLQFPNLIQPWFLSHPNLTCTCIRAENMTPVIVLNMILILILKIFLIMKEEMYKNLNHKKTFVFVLSILLNFTIAEHIIIMVLFGTFCVKSKIERLKAVNGIHISDDEIKHGPMLFTIHVGLLFVVGIIYGVIKLMKKRRCKKKIKPAIISNLIEIPHANKKLTSLSETNKNSANQSFIYIKEAAQVNTYISTYENKMHQEAADTIDELKDDFKVETIDKTKSYLKDDVNDEIRTLQTVSNLTIILTPKAINLGLEALNIIEGTIDLNTKVERKKVLKPVFPQVSANIGVGVCVSLLIAVVVVIFATNRNNTLKNASVNSLIAVLVSLGLHISPVALVINSAEITDFMIHKLRYCYASILNNLE